MQGRLPAIQSVQIADQRLKSRVVRVFSQMPVQTALGVPFLPLTEFAPHKQKFLAGMAEHIPIVRPQVRELLPGVAGHFVEQGSFAVNDLVV